MENKPLQIPATLMSARTLSDGGMGLSFHTQELSKDEQLVLLSYVREFGFLLFKENEFSPEDIPKEQAEFGGKSQGKRLRDVLWRVREVELERKPSREEFEKFWIAETEKIIEHYKKRLPIK